MIFDSEGNTTTVFQENISLQKFLENLNGAYPGIKNDNLIINLFSFDTLTANDLLEFLSLSELHVTSKKSFVLVTDRVAYDEVPDGLCVVPTLQEAKDMVDMEEMERDLGL